jgi:hypothetical protein
MDRYASFFATKRAMIDTLRPGWASGRISTPRGRVTAAIGGILDEGARAGVLRADVDPDDITMLLLGLLLSTGAEDSPERTGRLLDLVVDALRPRA